MLRQYVYAVSSRAMYERAHQRALVRVCVLRASCVYVCVASCACIYVCSALYVAKYLCKVLFQSTCGAVVLQGMHHVATLDAM